MLHEQLEAERKRARVTRQELAARLGLTYSMVQRLEEGWKEMEPGFEARYRSALLAITRERLERVAATVEA